MKIFLDRTRYTLERRTIMIFSNDIQNFLDFSLSGHIKLGNKKTSV